LRDWREILGKIMDVDISQIEPDPENLRELFEPEEIEALGRNMLEVGQLDEIRVFPKFDGDRDWNGRFDLYDGERRWRAAKAVGFKKLRALVEERPSEEELTFKKISRVMQTESLKPNEKVFALEKTFARLGILEKPAEWDKYRKKLGPGQERFAELTRVLKLSPSLRQLVDRGVMSYTISHAVGRLPQEKQEETARYILAHKLHGRYVSTELIPYMVENPDATFAQAYEHTRVGGWRQYTKRPGKQDLEESLSDVLDSFLDACVRWERAWEHLVETGLIFQLRDSDNSKYRLSQNTQRMIERCDAILAKMRETYSEEDVKQLPAEPKKLPAG